MKRTIQNGEYSLTTSLYIHLDVLARLNTAAKELKCSRRDLISMLLMRVANEIDRCHGRYRAVRYQATDPLKRWRRTCIRFSGDEYERVTDLRKFCKSSVSLLLAVAVHKYLPKIEKGEEQPEVLRNGRAGKGYAIGRAVLNGIVCWTIAWGGPRKPGRSLPSFPALPGAVNTQSGQIALPGKGLPLLR